MKVIEYHPSDVCSRLYKISVDEGKIVDIEIVGGCQGNLRGLRSLLKGMEVKDAIKKLEGIECRGSRTGKTSCPDQIAKALKTI